MITPEFAKTLASVIRKEILLQIEAQISDLLTRGWLTVENEDVVIVRDENADGFKAQISTKFRASSYILDLEKELEKKDALIEKLLTDRKRLAQQTQGLADYISAFGQIPDFKKG